MCGRLVGPLPPPRCPCSWLAPHVLASLGPPSNSAQHADLESARPSKLKRFPAWPVPPFWKPKSCSCSTLEPTANCMIALMPYKTTGKLFFNCSSPPNLHCALQKTILSAVSTVYVHRHLHDALRPDAGAFEFASALGLRELPMLQHTSAAFRPPSCRSSLARCATPPCYPCLSLWKPLPLCSSRGPANSVSTSAGPRRARGSQSSNMACIN